MSVPNYGAVPPSGDAAAAPAAAPAAAAGGGGAASANAKLTSNEQANKMNAYLSSGYNTHVFGCFEDPMGCVVTCCCPCWVMATAKAQLDERPCTVFDFCCGTSGYQIRQTIRAKYKIPYSPLSDAVSYCCCQVCSMNQEIRGLASRSGKPPVFYQMPE